MTLEPARLPSYAVDERRYLPSFGGIYFFLTQTGEVAYIGQATDIRERARSHNDKLHTVSNGIARIAWIAVRDVTTRLGLERNFIRQFRPPLNIQGLAVQPQPRAKSTLPPLAVYAGEYDSGDVGKGEPVIRFHNWMTIREAATELGISKRAVLFAIDRHPIEQARIEHVILLYRADVARYRATRQQKGRRGPRQPSADR